MKQKSEVIPKIGKLYKEVKGKSEKVKPLHKSRKGPRTGSEAIKKEGGYMTYNKDKNNDNVTNVT